MQPYTPLVYVNVWMIFLMNNAPYLTSVHVQWASIHACVDTIKNSFANKNIKYCFTWLKYSTVSCAAFLLAFGLLSL